MRAYLKAWAITTVIISLCIFAYNCVYTVRPGYVALIQHTNGEVSVEDRIGYHMTLGTVIPIQKSLIERTDKLGGTLYNGKTTVGESFDLSSPNKNLVRIK